MGRMSRPGRAMPHVIIIRPSAAKPDRFNVEYEGARILADSQFPFRDAARHLLARELAQPAHMLIMRHAGSDKEVRRALVGIAAKEATTPAGKP
jgi:hypothetical protein